MATWNSELTAISSRFRRLHITKPKGMNFPQKRKRDVMDDDDDSDDSSIGLGDGKRSNPEISNRLLMAQGTSSGAGGAGPQVGGDCQVAFHRYTVYFLPDDQEKPGSSGSGDVVEHTFECPLKDIWGNKYDQHSVPSGEFTGDPGLDKILTHLNEKGLSFYQQLERGMFGFVCLAYSKAEKRFAAIKILQSGSRVGKRKLRRTGSPQSPTASHGDLEELSIHQKLHHPNIVQLFDSCSVNGSLCLVMEFCQNGNLLELLNMQPGRFITEPIARKYFQGMVNAVSYVHLQCIVHRDLKCQNFVIDHRNTIKLCDFGSAKHYTGGDSLFTDKSGSAGYQAPEVFAGKPYNPRLVDVWSLGITLFHMVTGKLPYGKANADISNAMNWAIPFPEARVMRLTDNIKELIKGIMSYIPEARFSLTRVQNSAWYTAVNKKVYIGNFHLVRQPQKCFESPEEKACKEDRGIS